jgi:DNA topoisomerase-1
MEKAEYLFQDIDIKGGKYLFRVISSKIKFDGFLKVYKYKEEREKEQREIPSLKEKEKVRLLKLEPKQHFTSPPPRFSEATLIKTLEEKGIGRPSTYVPIITTICNRNYVKREKGKFYPTELGMTVNRLLIANFPNIVDINFTSFMEEQLDKIENGDKNWIKILDEFWRPFSSSLEEAKIRMEDIRKEREVEVEEECPKCKSKLKIKIGRFGEFLACASYPECNYTKSKGLGINCPNKDCSGEIIRRRTKKGKIFYGCSNYPECNFVSWDEPTESICPDCKGILFKRRFKNREYLVCINKDCQKKEEI